MKRTTITLFLAIVLGFFAQATSYAPDNEQFELVKGGVVDKNHDGEWARLRFFVLTENPSVDVPVISIDIILSDGTIIPDVRFLRSRNEKSVAMYQVKLMKLGVVGDFEIRVKLDTSAIVKTSFLALIDGGPGSIPNETILIIKYP